MNLINRIFNSNNDSYTLAKNCLSKVRTKLDAFTDNFPDVTIPELLYIDQKWSILPETLGVGVSVMGLEVTNHYSSLLTHFNEKGYLVPHEHINDYELNKIIKGSVSNKLTGERFETGDTFIIDKNERHYLLANEETFIYTVLASDEEYLTVPHIKPNILEYFNQVQNLK